ncbi:MAG: hypothetical protein EP330_08740 [Deltaproteobacteria bacterium]|nr:MAG: hypothetical protein EP330_08740 [Deltaproteobacteria bacterium]
MLLLVLSLVAGAADWITANNTERGRPEGQQLIGFVQPNLGVSTRGEATGLQGALAPYEGEVPLFNRVYGVGPIGVGVQRARLGARGTIGHPKLSTFLLLEFGQNGITRNAPVAVTDATLSWDAAPGFGLRVGQQKLPMMEENWPAVPVALEWVNFSNTSLRLTGENHAANGAYVGGASAFRDVGVSAFGTATAGDWQFGYSVVGGQGRSGGVDLDRYKDVTGRVQLARVFGESTGPFREELSLVFWGQTGARDVDGERFGRHRGGAALRLELGEVWALAEGVLADGVIDFGLRPPFPGGAVLMVGEGHGRGAVISAGVRQDVEGIGKIGVKLRYDQAGLWSAAPEDTRLFQTVSAGVEVDPAKKLRVLATYEHRNVRAPDAAGPVQGLLDQVGDRVDLQVTARL